MSRSPIREYAFHSFQGEFPVVETYPHVDAKLLTEGDEQPFYLTLPIAEIGRVSENGLVYDADLVGAIASQMQEGKGGIRGHLKDEELSTAYPIDSVCWVGHQMVGETLWAKGYVPPGENRDDIRRKKAVGGRIATSIFGDAVRETVSTAKGRKTWRARDFRLDTIDLAPAGRAALRMKQEFQITREMEEGEMPDEITAADVPQKIREQIIRDSEVARQADRVAEMETQVSVLDAQVKEMATYKTIVTEIRQTLKTDVNTAEMVAEQYAIVSKLAEMLGVPYTNIAITVQEQYEQIAEMKQKAFTGAVEGKVAEMTPWNVTKDEHKAKVGAFRANFKRALLAELGDKRDSAQIAETATRLWDSEFKPLAEMVVRELSGGSAIVNGNNPTDQNGGRVSDEQLTAWAAQYNRTPNAASTGSK